MTDGLAPPRPRLVLRVGVTGHKADRLHTEHQVRLDQEVRRVLGKLAEAARRIHEQQAKVLSHAPPMLRIVSALADGADTLVAQAGLAMGAVLNAPLPFPREVYRDDFTTPEHGATFDALLAQAEAVFELDGDRGASDRAYEAAGLMVLRQCDVLLAIWDGAAGRGRGGAFDIIRVAVSSGIPVIWITPDGRTARLLRLPAEASAANPADLAHDAPEAGASALERLAVDLLAPPEAVPEPPRRRGRRSADELRKIAAFESRRDLEDLLTEPEQRGGRISAYRMLLFVSRAGGLFGDRRPYVVRALERWEPFMAQTRDYADRLPRHCSGRLLDAFKWTDGLAGRYGDLHRDAAVANFVLSAFAVFLSLVTVFDTDHTYKPLCVVGELAVIALIVGLTMRGRARRWHERWVDYRALSEHLRLIRVLSMVGSAAINRSAPSDRRGEAIASWTEWYYGAFVREVALPAVRVDDAYLRTVLATLQRSELDDQIRYHRRNAERMEQVEETLEGIGIFTIATVVAFGLIYLGWWAVLHLAGVPHPEPPGRFAFLVTFVAGLLPAVGAACLGIREHGEFGRRRDLSMRMKDRLRRLRLEVRWASRAPTLAEVAALVEASAAAMTAEVGDWSFILRARPLGLPS